MADLQQELRSLGLPSRAIAALREEFPSANTVEEIKSGLATISEGQFCYRPNFSSGSLAAINEAFGPWPFRKTDKARQELDEKIQRAEQSVESARKALLTKERNLKRLRAKRAALDN